MNISLSHQKLVLNTEFYFNKLHKISNSEIGNLFIIIH